MAISEMISRIVRAFMDRRAGALENLERYLKTQIRPVIMENLASLESILKPLAISAERSLGEIDFESFYDDMLDGFLKSGGKDPVDAILSGFRSYLKYDAGIERGTANSLIHDKSLTPEQRRLLDKHAKKLAGIMYEYLKTYFKNKQMHWVDKKRDILEKQLPDERSVPPEVEELEEDPYGLKEVKEFIRRDFPEKKNLYLDLLSYLTREEEGEGEKLIEIAKKHNMAPPRVTEDLKKLIKALATFLKARGVGKGEALEYKPVTEKIPVYTEVFKDKKKSKDFIDALKFDPQVKENTREVVRMFGEGKTVDEVFKETGAVRNTLMRIKNRYFDPRYKKWYKEQEKQDRKAYMKLAKVCGLWMPYERIAQKTVRVPFEKDDDRGKEVSKVHSDMAQSALEKRDFLVTVEFSSKYNYPTMMGKDLSMEDPEFKWLQYQLEFSKSRGTKSVDYRYVRKVTATGEWEGAGRSTLEIDGQKVSTGLQTDLDDYVEEEILPEGLMPHEKKSISVHYINKKTGEKIVGVDKFKRMYHNIYYPDPAHEARQEYINRMKERKWVGIDRSINELNDQLLNLKRRIREEKDPSKKSRIKDIIKKVEELKEERQKATPERVKKQVDLIEAIMEQEDLIARPAEEIVPEEQKVKKPKEAMDYDRLQELKWRLDDGGDMLIFLKRQIREETCPDRKYRMKKLIDRINKGDVKQRESVLEEALELIEKKARMVYAAEFPSPKSEDAREWLDLMYKYGLKVKPNPKGWLTPIEIRTLARTYRTEAQREMVEDLKEIEKDTKTRLKGVRDADVRKEVMEREEKKKKNLQDAVAREIANSRKLFKAIVDDLRDRRDEFKKKHPRDYESFARGRDMDWVDDKDKVSKLVNGLDKDLERPVSLKEVKQPSMKTMDIGEYRSLEGWTKNLLEGVDEMISRFARSPVKPGELAREKIRINEMAKKVKGTKAQFLKSIADLEKQEGISGEQKQELQELKNSLGVLLQKEYLDKLSIIPAVNSARFLQGYLRDLSKLFSTISSMIWYREKYSAEEEGNPEEELLKEESKLEALKDQIVQQGEILSGLHLRARDKIKSLISSLRQKVKKFLEKADDLEYAYSKRSSVEALMPYRVFWAQVSQIVPEALMNDAKKVIKELKESPNKMVRDLAPVASEELNEVVKNIHDAFSVMTAENAKEIAEEKGLSVKRVNEITKQLQNDLIKEGLDAFIMKYKETVLRGFPARERTELGTQPADKYENMAAFLNRVPEMKELFEKQRTPDVEKKPSAGIPTVKEIREHIEEAFAGTGSVEESEKEIRQFIKEELGQWSGEGGGGGKGKTRQKEIKPPPPKILWEKMRVRLADMIREGQSPRRIVTRVMAEYLSPIKEALEAGKYVSRNDVIIGLVDVVKSLQGKLTAMRVGDPGKGIAVDIPVENNEEAKKLLDTIVGIYEVANQYIEPDQIGIPSESLKNVRKFKKLLPTGLMQFEPEGGVKKSGLYDYPTNMSYNVALKFAGMRVEGIPEHEMALS